MAVFCAVIAADAAGPLRIFSIPWKPPRGNRPEEKKPDSTAKAEQKKTALHGLALTPAQARALAADERQALLSTGRVAFGSSAAQRLIPAFCASPNVERQTWCCAS